LAICAKNALDLSSCLAKGDIFETRKPAELLCPGAYLASRYRRAITLLLPTTWLWLSTTHHQISIFGKSLLRRWD
jgi:hypothetical protein